jgi:hypothetical protein
MSLQLGAGVKSAATERAVTHAGVFSLARSLTIRAQVAEQYIDRATISYYIFVLSSFRGATITRSLLLHTSRVAYSACRSSSRGPFSVSSRQLERILLTSSCCSLHTDQVLPAIPRKGRAQPVMACSEAPGGTVALSFRPYRLFFVAACLHRHGLH